MSPQALFAGHGDQKDDCEFFGLSGCIIKQNKTIKINVWARLLDT